VLFRSIYASNVEDKIIQIKRIYIEYFTNKYSNGNFILGSGYGELNKKGSGIKITNGIYLNDPFTEKIFI
jgi:hypothetical protein